MRNVLLALLTGSTALASSLALAQAPPPASPEAATSGASSTATSADCDRLLTFLEQRHPANPGITAEQVNTYKTNKNTQACRDALARIDPAAAPKEGAGTNIVIQQPAPAVRVQQASPQVTVQQEQPQVTVRQPQPEIFVRQPAPTVTVDIPQPEITIKMPRPDVNVAMVQPQVEVKQAPPQVHVTELQQPQVQVQKAAGSRVNVEQSGTPPKVQVQEEGNAPTVHYERADPHIVVNQAKGEPTVHIQQAGGPQQEGAKQQSAGVQPAGHQEPATTGAVPRQNITVSRLKNAELYSERGSRLGVMERVVQSDDGKRHLVVGMGGFLGVGEKHVMIPAEDVALRGDRFVAEGLTDDQLKKMPSWDSNNRDFHDIEGNAVIQISSR